MSFLFMKRSRSPQEHAKTIEDSINKIENSTDAKKGYEELSKSLTSIKNILNNNNADHILQFSQAAYENNLFFKIVRCFAKLEFEQRKDATHIFISLISRDILSRYPLVEYLSKEKTTIKELIKGYKVHKIALNCGQILRECNKHETLNHLVLESAEVYEFFDYIEIQVFDIAADAFQTFRELLTTHKAIALNFLRDNFENFFEKYTKLLNSSSYVNRRQSLRLLSDLFLDKTNFSVMTKFVANSENLKIIMNLLRDKSRNIQFEAFHVFKIFIANPNKTSNVNDILLKNKEKLQLFLKTFQTDRKEDDQFHEEREFLISEIKKLK